MSHRTMLIMTAMAASCATILFTGCRPDTSPRGETFDPVSRAATHPITATQPSPNFFEGAVLGNGGLGVIVCTRPDAVVMHFGHNDVWDIRVAEDNRDKIGTFREIYDKVAAIPDTLDNLMDDPWYDSYVRMARANYAKPYPRPFPCGSAVLWFDRREAELIGHSIDIATGVCTVDFVKDGDTVHLEVFTDTTTDRLLARMVDGNGAPIPAPFVYLTIIPDSKTPAEFPPYTAERDHDAGRFSFRQVLPYTEVTESNPYKAHDKDRAFSLTASVDGPFGETAAISYYEPVDPGGDTIDMDGLTAKRIDMRTFIDRERPFVISFELVNGLASDVPESGSTRGVTLDDCSASAGASAETWHAFWERSGVALDDDILERTWYHNLYFFRCALREGVTCPGLFANWSLGNIGTAWHGDYHMNYNTQQPFWLAFSSNHPELHLPYVDMVETYLLPVSRAWARDYYGMRGAFFPHSAYPVDMTMMPYPLPHWGWEVCETPWTVQSLWWHYQYTGDTAFLRDRAFPIITDAVMFLVDYMSRPEAHGPQWGDDLFHIFPSVPPELYGLRPGFEKNSDVLADITLTRFIFNAYLDACEVLEIGAAERDLMGQVTGILERMPPYPTAPSQRGTVFVSVAEEDPETVYNVPASLMTVFPGEHHGLHSPPDIFSVAANTYRNQQNEGGNDIVFLNAQAARLGMLDLGKFKRQIHYSLMPNGTCADMILQIHGRYSNQTPFDWMAGMGIWFENFSLPFVINECLMQSYTGEIRLFPNWPGDGDAEFRTLRAVGAFLVSARMNDGEVAWIEVTSEKGNPLSIISPWERGAMIESDGERTRLEGPTLTVATAPGQIVRFTPAR